MVNYTIQQLLLYKIQVKLTSNISVASYSISISVNKYPGHYRKRLYFRLFAIGFTSANIWNRYLLNGGTVFQLHLSKDSSNYTIFAIYSITKYSLFWNTKQVCTHMQHSSLRSLYSHWWNSKFLEKKNHLVCQQWHNVAQKQSADSVFTTICDPSSFCPAAAAHLMFLRMWDGFWALFFLVSSEARLLCWFCKSCSARSLWDEVVEVERCHSPSSACSAWSPLNAASWGWSARATTWHGGSWARLAAGCSTSIQQHLSRTGTDKPYSHSFASMSLWGSKLGSFLTVKES